MVINLIVAETDDDCYDIVAAWDEWLLDANYDGWEKDLAKWKARYPNVRVIEVDVPDDTYEKAFSKPPRVQGKIREQ